MSDHYTTSNGSALHTPLRNRYFYGQLLGVENFELETSYAIGQRRLLNRLVLGCGVVCGLGVEVADDGVRLRVAPGVAIDRWGQEIVVPDRTGWINIPADVMAGAVQRAGDCKDDACVQVRICYHECRGDPAVVLAGDCRTADPCAPSTIRERYRLEFCDECAQRPEQRCGAPNLITGGRIDQEQLARWVTNGRECTRLPRDPCIALANLKVIEVDGTPRCDPEGVDIGVRPILPSNVVLRELILALLGRDRQQQQYQ
jgi:hypothetical protein